MIKPIRAYLDSDGKLFATPGEAIQSEFRKALSAFEQEYTTNGPAILVDTLVTNFNALERALAEAMREDSRAQIEGSPS